MNFLSNIYQESMTANERNIRFWENYIQNLKSIDFNTFSDKLKVPALVPIGSRILFRGELRHTNEVTVALGADYFVKCSLKQAEILRQHRIKGAESKLSSFRKEREYLENQLSFSKTTLYDNEGQDIIEVHTEEEDKAWREKHKENVKKYKQSQIKEEDYNKVADEELWQKLEELELQEELENELIELKYDQAKEEITLIKEHDFSMEDNKIKSQIRDDRKKVIKDEKIMLNTDQMTNENHSDSKLELLQKVLDKQNELEEKLVELKNKERSDSKTEQDLLKKLDEMEELEELEDEMDRLNDILETDDIEEPEEDTTPSQTTKIKRKVSFHDEDDSETLEITFQHSNIEPCKEPYDPAKGIQKPSDIYKAFSHLFSDQTVSILKKSKYTNPVPSVSAKVDNKTEDGSTDSNSQRETIIVKDVIEKIDQNDNQFTEIQRPVSIFKKRRQQMK